MKRPEIEIVMTHIIKRIEKGENPKKVILNYIDDIEILVDEAYDCGITVGKRLTKHQYKQLSET